MPRCAPSSRTLISNLYASSQQADQSWTRDRRAATKIQSTFKMHLQRCRFLLLLKCVIALQRVYRGYRDRLYVLDEQIANAENRRAQIFHCHARNIQRVFRGFICRKYTSDFCAQKAYISQIAQTSESVRQAGIRARGEQERYLAVVQEAELRKDFALAAKDKHHLLSTAVCPGVFRTPLEPEGTKTLFGTDVEEEIRSIPVDMDEIRVLRSKFLKDVIPVVAVAGGGGGGGRASGKLQGGQQAATTGRVNEGGGGAAASVSSASLSRTAVSVQSAKKAAGARTTIGQEPYKRSLQGEADYEPSDRSLDRKIEEKIISKLHGAKSGNSYFHVPNNTTNSKITASGFVAKMKP